MDYNNSSSKDQNKKSTLRINKTKPISVFIGFVLVSTFFAFILGGIYIGKENSEQKIRDEKTTVEEQIEINPVALPGNPDNWIIYKFTPLNIEFKLPEELNKKGEWKINEIPGDSGTQICFSDINLENEDNCRGNDLIITSTSNDFSTKKELSFLDLQGFEIKDGTYSVRGLDNKYELKDVRFKSFDNNQNFKIIKILGNGNSEFAGTPDKDYLGAVINTKNSNYPAIILMMKIDGRVSEYEFDQILESIKEIE